MTEETTETTSLLSVYVPTYNRAALLSQSLRAILGQITPEMAGTVEVVVADNASPDDTPAVVAQAQSDFPHVALRSVRRPENIGCDANFTDSPNQTQGRFVYMVSDDDILLPGAVAKLLELISRFPGFDAFCLNVRQFRDSPDEEGKSQAYTLEADQIVSGRDGALTLLKTHIIFISCIAFRRENVLGREYSERRATNMGQSYMFLDALAPGRGLYATRLPYLAQRAERAEGYNFFRVYVTNFHQMMQHARRLGYSSEAVRQVLDRTLDFVYHFVKIFKFRGGYDQLRPDFPDAVLRLLRAYPFRRIVWLKIIPRILAPSWLSQSIKRGIMRVYPGARRRWPMPPTEAPQ